MMMVMRYLCLPMYAHIVFIFPMKQSLFDFAKLLYSDEIIKKSDDISILLTYWLLVVGCWLLVDGCWLLVVGCLENKISMFNIVVLLFSGLVIMLNV